MHTALLGLRRLPVVVRAQTWRLVNNKTVSMLFEIFASWRIINHNFSKLWNELEILCRESNTARDTIVHKLHFRNLRTKVSSRTCSEIEKVRNINRRRRTVCAYRCALFRNRKKESSIDAIPTWTRYVRSFSSKLNTSSGHHRSETIIPLRSTDE